MKLNEILGILDDLAPLALQESYDNSGLQAGLPDAEVSSCLICLDCTESVMKEAVKKGCDLIISHHPVLFKPLKSITGQTTEERVLLNAIRNNIAIVSLHTNLDNIRHGVSAAFASKLGLENTQVLRPLHGNLSKLYTFCPVNHAEVVRAALFSAGCGKIGNYDACSFNSCGTGTFRAGDGANPYVGKIGEIHSEDEIRIETVFPTHLTNRVVKALLSSHPYEEVAYDIHILSNAHPNYGAGLIGELPDAVDEDDFLDEIINITKRPLRHSQVLGRKVKTVAVCGGAGIFLMEDAIHSGADAFISADFKYHDFFSAADRVLAVDAGHYETECQFISIVSNFLKEKIPTFAVHLTENNTNPIHFFLHDRSKSNKVKSSESNQD